MQHVFTTASSYCHLPVCPIRGRLHTYLDCIAKMVQVAGSNQAIATVVARACQDQHPGVAGAGVLCCQGAGDAKPCQLHELVNAKPQRPHELLINRDRLLLRPVWQSRQGGSL